MRKIRKKPYKYGAFLKIKKLVKLYKTMTSNGKIRKNKHKNEQKSSCNLRVFKIYLGQNKEKENAEGGIKE